MPKVSPKTHKASLLEGYRPLPEVPDELLDASGAMRGVWAGLIAHLDSLALPNLAAQVARGEQYLREAGVYFRRYGATTLSERDWPFTPVPIVLSETEWDEIAEGLAQRADLLEAVAADLYGPNRLVTEGHLPATLVGENPEWLRPLVGVKPRGGHFLHFLAFEIGRGPDGRWWVLGDRTQAPSGAGFALENRVASSRVFAEYYPTAHVRRLAGFFRAFRDSLNGLQANASVLSGSKVGILTPGPMTDTYYEHAYIARYLGMPLLEGADLTVEGDAVKVRTVSGPVPIDVLWRRLDSGWADPLELRENSQIGTPGLLSAVRAGEVTLVNALGVGVLEAQAMLAFLPRISEALTGQPLKMPNIATWWCGQEAELAHVRAEAHRMLIGPALATRLPFETEGTHALARELRGAEGPFDDWLSGNAGSLVGQELVTLSTTPVLIGGRLEPRPMTIRVFLARTPQGWVTMPGGFARIATGNASGTAAIAMAQGSSVADVWVVSDHAVAEETMLSRTTHPFARAEAGALPARAADNLFWLGRYVERTEGVLRLTRAWNARLADDPRAALVPKITRFLTSYGVDPVTPMPPGLVMTLGGAVNSASQIRDRFSVDGWAALTDLDKTMRRMASTVTAGTDAALAMGVLLRKIAGFSGLVHENMYRAAGWRFLTIGRSLERAATMADVLRTFTADTAPTGSLDLAIEIGDSAMTHRQRYPVTTSRESVVDLLALDGQNPRSILFHLNELREQADALGGQPHASVPATEFGRRVLEVQTKLALHSPESLTPEALTTLRSDILALSDVLGASYLL